MSLAYPRGEREGLLLAQIVSTCLRGGYSMGEREKAFCGHIGCGHEFLSQIECFAHTCKKRIYLLFCLYVEFCAENENNLVTK
jgi:hypothetical protein